MDPLLLTALVAAHISYPEPRQSSSYYEPAPAPEYVYTSPQRFPYSSPNSERDWDNLVEHSMESRWSPTRPKHESVQYSERDIDAYVELRAKELPNTKTAKAARTFGVIGSKVSPWIAPRVSSYAMEDRYQKGFGINERETDPHFRQQVRENSGRDFDNISKGVSKAVGSFTKKTVKAWTHDDRQQAFALMKEGALEACETLQPHATQAVKTLVEEHGEHAAAIAGPVAHGFGIGRMAHRGNKATKDRLERNLNTYASEAKRQHKSKLSLVFEKLNRRKRGESESDH